jgi:hypothetical protein
MGAAAVAAWSARRQASAQSASQENQWLREKRLDAYSTFLDAGVQARDELAGAWRLFKASNREISAIRTQLESAYPLVISVNRASAQIHATGPEPVLYPTKQAEENIVVFHRLLLATIGELEANRSVDDDLLLCAQQYARVRSLLDSFAASTREVFGGDNPEGELLKVRSIAPAEEELAWLVNAIAGELLLGAEGIDVKRSLFEAGIGSIQLVRFFAMAEMEFGLSGSEGWSISSLLFKESIEEVALYIAELRRRRNTPQRNSLRHRAG